MRTPPTGEPYAGQPPVRFGGRGGRQPFPTPIELRRRTNRRRPVFPGAGGSLMIKALLTPVILGLAVAAIIRIATADRA